MRHSTAALIKASTKVSASRFIPAVRGPACASRNLPFITMAERSTVYAAESIEVSDNFGVANALHRIVKTLARFARLDCWRIVS